ncbi:MAG: hypothetical protein KY468_14925 [Armatimonadetes bacterium]|nr:hypothetical protein [Armatimonadota bacterium]
MAICFAACGFSFDEAIPPGAHRTNAPGTTLGTEATSVFAGTPAMVEGAGFCCLLTGATVFAAGDGATEALETAARVRAIGYMGEPPVEIMALRYVR